MIVAEIGLRHAQHERAAQDQERVGGGVPHADASLRMLKGQLCIIAQVGHHRVAPKLIGVQRGWLVGCTGCRDSRPVRDAPLCCVQDVAQPQSPGA